MLPADVVLDDKFLEMTDLSEETGISSPITKFNNSLVEVEDEEYGDRDEIDESGALLQSTPDKQKKIVDDTMVSRLRVNLPQSDIENTIFLHKKADVSAWLVWSPCWCQSCFLGWWWPSDGKLEYC